MSLIATLLAALSLLSASDTADLQHAAAALEAEANARAEMLAADPGRACSGTYSRRSAA
jgi:hypothetical protein